LVFRRTIRNKMCKSAGLNLECQPNNKRQCAIVVSNKLGKGGLALTDNKQYYKASRKADKKGKSRYCVLQAWLTYPGSREWCDKYT
jgi:hypothetical protein